MKKRFFKFVAVIGACLLSVNAFACGDNEKDKVKEDYKVWTTYSTAKVVQDPSLNNNHEMMQAGITVKMAKNEMEMGQFFVTTGEQKITRFDLVPLDLKNAQGDIFPVENMEVYVEKCVRVKNKSRGNTLAEYPVGYIPDALVPMELYKKAGDNSIAPNCNQGFLVDFTTYSDTPAGEYTGNFQLVLNKKVINIPVSVTVADYSLPERSNSTSCVLIYEDSIMQGEMTSEVDGWYEIYYEHALKYKMNPYMVPDSTKGPDKFADSVVKYYDSPNFSSYGLPHQSYLPETYSKNYRGTRPLTYEKIGEENKSAITYWFDCLYILGIRAARNGKNYFDGGYFYPIDEPETSEQVRVAQEWLKDLQYLREDVADILLSDGVFDNCNDSFRDKCMASLRNMQIVVTALADEKGLAEYDVTYVPQLHEINDYSVQTNIEEHAIENNNDLWYYTQIDPAPPAPTTHIDDFLVSARLLKWIQKYYDIKGWLYWDYNELFQKEPFAQEGIVIDPFEETDRALGDISAQGDGYFVYPANSYGSDEPIPSIRLLAYRDGQDDMDILCYLDELYSEYENYYGVAEGEFKANKVLKGLYDRLFCRSVAFSNDKVYAECKDILSDTVSNAINGNDKFVYTVDYNGIYADYSFYVADGYAVKLNGTALNGVQSGSGNKFSYRVNIKDNKVLSAVTLVKDGTETEKRLFEKDTVNAVDIGTENITLTVTENSIVEKVKDASDNNVWNFTIKSVQKQTETQTLRFTPSITIKGLPSFNVIEIDLENLTSEATEMYLVFVSSDGYEWKSDIGLTKNTFRTVEILNRMSSGRNIETVRIEFKNADIEGGATKLYADRDIRISGIRVR